MAKLHYRGKNHEKKIRKWLTEYSERTGEPLHKRAKVVPKKPEPTTLVNLIKKEKLLTHFIDIFEHYVSFLNNFKTKFLFMSIGTF